MRIVGRIMGTFLTVMILGTTLVLFTVLPIRPPVENILEESISGRLELHQERKGE